MKTIAIINMKGGCGKTTTAVNMAHILAADHDKKVLVIDNDKQGNLSKTCDVWSYELPSLAELFTGQKDIKEIIQATNTEGVSAVPANMHLLTANLMVAESDMTDKELILKRQLETVASEYDYCIIDCPPDINIGVINALAAADEVIIPIKIDNYAFEGMKELKEQIDNAKAFNPTLKLKGCLVTLYYNREVCRQGKEYLVDQGYPVFRTHIRRTEKADEATFASKSIMEYSPYSAAARDYKAFVEEYLEN